MENCKTELRWTLFFFSMRYLAPTIVPTSATHSPRERYCWLDVDGTVSRDAKCL